MKSLKAYKMYIDIYIFTNQGEKSSRNSFDLILNTIIDIIYVGG